ncbi:MAG TPA: TraB/GumN family protein [Steroidobacteraceae bacterium]|nr:TraB/GumN family protein [Steroidobacteraceae bacterium]
MWVVRYGDHTLWILGTLAPLPKKFVWQPDAVREVLKQTQEVIPAWPTYGIGANPFTALRVYIEWRRLQKPPDRLPLRQTLPPQLYSRVEALKARYDPHDDKLETMRPMFAARQLTTRVFDATGLALHNEVQQTVLRLAAEEHVRVRQNKLHIDDPVDVLKDVNATSLESEVNCLESVVTMLETDIAPMQARASAWALGDVDTLRKLPYAGNRAACLAAVSTSERVRTLIARAQDDWLIQVEEGLRHNRGTLAVQSMDRLLGESGALATLRAKGFSVEGP